MKKFLSIVLSLSMILSMSSIAFASENNSVQIHQYDATPYVDEAGTLNEIQTQETSTEYIVDQYINGVLDNTVTTNKSTWVATMITYGDTDEVTSYDLHDYMEVVERSTPVAEPRGNIDWSSSYSILNTYNTDYLYQGQILKANTKTAAFEPSTTTRHGETILNFSEGDKISLIVSALLTAFGGAITTLAVVALGLPVLAGKVIDGFTRSVWKTDFKVSTKVYFNNIYTGLISQTYTDVLVSEMTNASGKKITYYADDCYGYDIIRSQSSYAASGCAVAFVDKYVTGNNPNLSLPITSLPYYG